MRNFILPFVFVITFSFCSEKLPNDIRWVTASGEYQSLCRQIYHLAWQKVKSAAAQQKGDAAIVMDLDETVMDNSQYQVLLEAAGESFTMDSWSAWVNRAEAGLVPGAGAFLDSVRTLDKIYVIFVSNRMAERTEITRKNLEKLSATEKDDIFLLKQDRNDKKEIRRHEIFSGTGRMSSSGAFTVIAWFGDAMGDFPSETEAADFGESWFVLPNPMYGKW